MSSDYRVFCLSHDPAVEIEDGTSWTSADRALESLAKREDHAKCDVVMGRYSYPLIEVGCVRATECGHRDAIWMDAQILRLLLHMQAERSLSNATADALCDVGNHTCWRPYRLARMRNILDGSL